MNPASNPDYKRLISELIKKQMVILGPDITFAKARNILGLTLDNNGEVQNVVGDPKVVFNELSNQFVELSSMIVKKTMESVLQANVESSSQQTSSTVLPDQNTQQPQVMPQVTQAQNEVSSQVLPPQPPQIVSQPQNIPSPDQKLDPLIQTIQMPDDNFFLNKKSEPPSFTLSELESLNKALKEESSKSQQTSF